MIDLRITRLHELALIPKSWTEHAIGLDLHACIPTDTPGGKTTAMIPSGAVRAIRTCIAVEPPENFFLMVCSRSGLAKNHGVFVINSPGIIDPDYRGEIIVLLLNSNYATYYVKHGDRIAQLIAMPAHSLRTVEVSELSSSLRGDQGFGSTGSGV